MSSVKEASVQGARDFFSGELKSALERQHVAAEPGSVEYLADLLCAYMKSDTFFVKGEDGKLRNNILAELYTGYLQGSPETRKIFLKRLGDICLLVTGMFPDSLRRKVVDLDYYFGMGGTAYAQLAASQLTGMARTLFGELSTKFVTFSSVLSELAEKNALHSNSDLLRLYERWLFTGNERLKDLLSRHGIRTPVGIDTKVRH